MLVHLTPDRVSLQPGDLSPREVRAARSVNYLNSVVTARLQQAALSETRPFYDYDKQATDRASQTIREIFQEAEAERGRRIARVSGRGTSTRSVAAGSSGGDMRSAATARIAAEQFWKLLSLPRLRFQQIRRVAMAVVANSLERGVRNQPDDMPHVEDSADVAARKAGLRPEEAVIVRTLVNGVVRPNQILNRQKTDAAREAAVRAVSPVYEHIARGDLVVAAGERVTQQHLDQLTALGLRDPHMEPKTGLAVGLLTLAMLLLVVFYISRALPALYGDRRRLALLALIVALSVFGLKVAASMLGLSFSGGQLGYLGMMSVAAAGMLVSVLLDMHLAVIIVAMLSALSGLLMNHEIRFAVMTLLSSLVGIISVGSARGRSNLLGTTMAMAAANLALVWILGLLLRDALPELLTGSAWAVASAAFATFLYWFGVLVLERPFGILTHTALLDLSASDRPLLQKLCALAPGTYAHSMLVGTLAEAGAQAIGADALLCRVAGYYHDIGKIVRPDFFVENQRRENVHCRLSPSLSALLITAHVRDGLQLACEHKLPVEIRDLIVQHHGTTLIRYFYHQALTDCGGADEAPPGLEERFRYPGPKPQTREAAVVMLADSVEAAARCVDKPTPERLEAVIDSIVRDKIEDGQFDSCTLTFKDVKAVSNAFLHVLTAMMHGRIDYPPPAPPSTATGRPMEVSRCDLQREIAPLNLPIAPPCELPLAAPEPATCLASEERTSGHGEERERLSMLPLLGPEEIRRDTLSTTTVSSECADPPPAAVPVAFLEPEVLYGRLSVEHVASQAQDAVASAGSPASARGRKRSPRRG